MDEHSLICDLAETYQIHDYRQYPPIYIATLSNGLSSNSRIKRKLAGVEASEEYLLNSLIFDRLNLLLWLQTKSGVEGKDKPVSLYETLTSKEDTNKENDSFYSSEDFELRRTQLIKSIQKGGIDID